LPATSRVDKEDPRSLVYISTQGPLTPQHCFLRKEQWGWKRCIPSADTAEIGVKFDLTLHAIRSLALYVGDPEFKPQRYRLHLFTGLVVSIIAVSFK